MDPAMKTTTPASMTLRRPSRSPEGAEREHEGGEQQGVGVDDPLQVGHRGVERLLQVVQRHAHDGGVEERQEEDAAQSGERYARLSVASRQNRFGQAQLSSSDSHAPVTH